MTAPSPRKGACVGLSPTGASSSGTWSSEAEHSVGIREAAGSTPAECSTSVVDAAVGSLRQVVALVVAGSTPVGHPKFREGLR